MALGLVCNRLCLAAAVGATGEMPTAFSSQLQLASVAPTAAAAHKAKKQVRLTTLLAQPIQ
jgi:hypothetical protein